MSSSRSLAQDEEFQFEAAPAPSFTGSKADPLQMWVEEKARLLNVLKEEIEPNLLPKDKDRLKKNVMRLGSYRSDWAEEAMDFLATNSSLSELYLYDYSRIHNQRLNQKILETLLKFSSFKYPTAALAFADDLSQNLVGKSLVIELFERQISNSSSNDSVQHLKDYVNTVFSSWGENLSAGDCLNIANRACQAGARFDLNDQGRLEEFFRSHPGFWSRVIFDELKSCYEGN